MERSQPKSRSRRFMARFDALELHACVELQSEDGEKFSEQDDESKCPTMFSVYGHLKTGGIQCLEDFETHEAALTWMKREATRCRFELGFEDFWEHGSKERSPSSAPPRSRSAMKKAKKAELHEFVVLAVETTEDGRDKAMFRWCKRCGLVEVTSAPHWGSQPLFLVPGDLEYLQGGSRWGRQSPPVCRLSLHAKGMPS